MFDDQQSSQTPQHQDNNQPAFGLGTNPAHSGGFSSGPTDDNSVPPIVEPTDTTTSASNDESPAQTAPAAISNDSSDSGSSSDSGLDNIKRQALDQLSPLVNQLEQGPEERYKTLMMMIQASDNQELIGQAYEAAQKISDEKARAEALLSIVNEINYFTQKSQ